jgi:signal transduction histidine kinase
MAQQQQNFMMAITHELKTPIAVAKLNLETLLKHKLDDSKQQKIIQMTLQETNRLNALTNNILISSQLEGEGYQSAKEELDLSYSPIIALMISGFVSGNKMGTGYSARTFDNRRSLTASNTR